MTRDQNIRAIHVLNQVVRADNKAHPIPQQPQQRLYLVGLRELPVRIRDEGERQPVCLLKGAVRCLAVAADANDLGV